MLLAPRPRCTAAALLPLLLLQGACMATPGPYVQGPAALQGGEAAQAGEPAEAIPCRRFRASLAVEGPGAGISKGALAAVGVGLMGVGLFAGMAASSSQCEPNEYCGMHISGGQIAGLALAGAGLLVTVVGLAAGAGPDPREAAAARCEEVLEARCASLDDPSCRAALARACAGDDAAACWALEPSGPPPRPPSSNLARDPCSVPAQRENSTCALLRALEGARPSAP